MSKIEQIIEEIEQYIDRCKYQPLSTSKIIVNKEELLELLTELRLKTPDEIKKYQSIIKNRDEILNKAKLDADAMLQQTAIQTNELINEHEIMQQAYSQANEIVTLASHQAQEILDNATIEANNMKAAAIQYTDEMLANLENLIAQTVNMTASHYESFMNNLNGYAEIIRTNRSDLHPQEVDSIYGGAEGGDGSESLNLDMLK